MTDYTHFYGIVGDGHVRGKRSPTPGLFDPVLAQIVTVAAAPSPAAVVNTVIRGTTSGARGRIIRVNSTTEFVIESWPNPTFFGQPGASFIAGAGLTGETVNFDNGGTAQILSVASGQRYPIGQQVLSEHFDAALQSFTPSDASDTPWYDRNAKFSRQLILTAASVAGDTQWIQGARCTNTTTGATFTILGAGAIGSDYGIQIIRASGAFNAGDALAVTTQANGAAGTDTAIIKAGGVGADPPQGAWVPHHPLPNLNGTGTLWEFPPNGNGTDGQAASLGPDIFIVRKAWEKHAASGSAPDRGSRTLLFSTFDHNSNSDAVLGGVTLQTVKCTGTFPTTWVVGEIVNAGGWSAKLHGFNAAQKLLYVFLTNGATLGAVTVTGATSASVATSTGAAFGWQKGSTYHNQFVAEKATALSRSGALYSGSAARWEGVFFAAWEAELGMFGANGAAWPSEDQMVAEWVRCIGDLRTELGRADLPVALFYMDVRSHAADVQQFGVPFAYLLRSMMRRLAGVMEHVTLVSTDGMQPAQTTALPYVTTALFLRTDDYVELGYRAWRSLEFAQWIIPAGNFEPLPLIFIGGQSQAVSGIPFSFSSFDSDPDLYSSAAFPGVNCADPAVRMWNASDGVKEWQTLDCALNGNTFFGVPPGSFSGVVVALAQRMKRRFSTDSGSAEVGFIHLPVNASSCNAESTGAIATWDPTAPARQTVSVSMTVTAVPAAGADPARGRFTAAPGTFSAFVVGQQVSVAGSALGFLGLGGNNHFAFGTAGIQAKAVDGSTIDLIGPYVTEGAATFTLQHGPIPLWPLIEAEVRLAFEKCATQLRRIPKPVLKVWWNGESDLNLVAGYQAALERVLGGIEDIFGQRHKGETPTATVILQLTRRTPWGVSDETIEAAIAAQANVATILTNAVAVSTDKLPMQSAGIWPRTQRQHNGVHHTARGFIMAGYLADQGANGLLGIPDHPEGSAAVDFGADGGAIIEDGSDAPPSEVGEGGDSGSPTDEITATEAGDILSKIDQAIATGTDVKAYTVNGRTVEMHSIDDLLAARKYFAAQQQRKLGLRRTRISFV